MPDTAPAVLASAQHGDAQRAELAARMLRAAPSAGVHACAVPGLSLIRADAPSAPLPCVYQPSLCMVVQGRKESVLGGEHFHYDPLHYLVVSMTVPVVARVTEASRAKPYLCLRVDVDTAAIADLATRIPPPTAGQAESANGTALCLARTDAPLLDAMLRLVRLLDAPEEAPILAPLALREIHYRAMTGELGPRLRALCHVDGTAHRIARAIELLSTRYDQHLSIDELARAAHMSPSALHQRFKAATRMTPLQFQKQLRLQKARRLMLSDAVDATTAAHRVGYESASQFSREYRRLFGAPPRRDIETARSGLAAPAATPPLRTG